jgi:hypothetical protein
MNAFFVPFQIVDRLSDLLFGLTAAGLHPLQTGNHMGYASLAAQAGHG